MNMKKLTKAERIFRATRFACRQHIESWGKQLNPDDKLVGFNNLICDEKDSVCSTRTFNDIQKLIDSEKITTELAFRYNLLQEDGRDRALDILNMVQSTLDNAIKNEKDFKELLKR